MKRSGRKNINKSKKDKEEETGMKEEWRKFYSNLLEEFGVIEELVKTKEEK